MQRWEYLIVFWSKKVVTLEFTHPQPEGEYSYPADPKESNRTKVRIDGGTRAYKEWTGQHWLTQVADYGWELVSGSYDPGSAGSWTSDYHLFFKRARPD